MRFRIALILQRLAHRLRQRHSFFRAPVAVIYRAYSLFLLSIDIPVSTKIGRGVAIFHGFGLVVHPNAVIEDGVVLRHGTTIGATATGPDAAAPRIESRADIGAGSVVIGDIVIGADAIIGAGSVVTKSVPPGGTVYGQAARLHQKGN